MDIGGDFFVISRGLLVIGVSIDFSMILCYAIKQHRIVYLKTKNEV
ncbi:MAG: hypothetical protein UW92_C0017G0002 [Candidatus Jorgensenbacteria bacterium GW2011_GWA2_45_13]|uniref:Uncharacterized protein n=1 Tax=Candidatus Jorgensenbacteria bacterium GW2011_GWA2_45_13 TaxID=1618662 RepID=A0A0G1P429_9BACT|nr:MAG: hypothetical protein UW92_C0017G0002 [Candidatus Jorgensenbacteria bacterium GW2011_GWA2_45_13]